MVSSNKRHLEFLIAREVWGPINHQVQMGIDCCLFKVAASEQHIWGWPSSTLKTIHMVRYRLS